MDTWYQRNRERILQHKREQYSNNAELRAKKREQALKRYYQSKMLDKMQPCRPVIKKGADSSDFENGSDFLQS